MRFLSFLILATILLGITGCYWGYRYYGDYPYHSRAAVAPGYVSYERPYAGVTYYDPGYDPYYYYDYYPTYRTYYPRARISYYGHYYRPQLYHGSERSYNRYPRPSSSSGRQTSFLRKIR